MEPTNKNRISLNFDTRIVIALLLAVIIAMLLLWRPWVAKTSDRTVEVSGQATVTAEPDEYVFYPSYQFVNADKDAALKELTAKSDTVVAKLKELGVADNKIKTNSSGYDYPVYLREDSKDLTYTLQLTVTIGSLEEAQKIQDYLVTTSPIGAVSPQAAFSDAKRKTLESQARDEATKDARAKADQSAKNLGFKVAGVKTVTDGSGFGEVFPMQGRAVMDSAAPGSAPESLGVQPGENDLNYSVTVTYYIR